MKKAFATAGVVLLSFMLSPKAIASTFSKFYIYGDSLSDTGNVFSGTGGLENPENAFPPSPPYAPGRFSNDDIWVDFVGDELGLTPSLIPPPGNTTIPPQGINYAIGGSSSGLDNALVPDSGLPGVLGQVNLFTQTVPVDPNALYAVWGGANDYVFGGVTDPMETVSNLSNAIGNLAQAGAKNIAVFNLPDLGQIPSSIANGNEVSTGLTQLTFAHNSALEQALDKFDQNPDVNIFRVDINSLFNQVVANPREFGFTQNPAIPCLIGDTLNNNITSVCDNPNDFVFFDGVHPSSKAHRLVADATLSAIKHQPIPEPSTIFSTLAVGAISTIGIFKGKRKKILR